MDWNDAKRIPTIRLRSRRRLRPGSPRRLSQIPTRVFEKASLRDFWREILNSWRAITRFACQRSGIRAQGQEPNWLCRSPHVTRRPIVLVFICLASWPMRCRCVGASLALTTRRAPPHYSLAEHKFWRRWPSFRLAFQNLVRVVP